MSSGERIQKPDAPKPDTSPPKISKPYLEVNGELVPIGLHSDSQASDYYRQGKLVLVDEEGEIAITFPDGYILPKNAQIGEVVIREELPET